MCGLHIPIVGGGGGNARRVANTWMNHARCPGERELSSGPSWSGGYLCDATRDAVRPKFGGALGT